MSTLLVLTVGQADVQIVLDGVRYELRKNRCAALHDGIERRGYVLCDAPVSKGAPVDRLPEGELKLCTPKLDAVLRKFVPTAVVLLETRRDAESAPGDPRFAGAVLEARLKAKGVQTVWRRVYLQGAERLENPNEPRDAVIRREVVERLEDAIRESLRAVNPSRIVVAATGGFPVVTNLVEEIVGLHAPPPAALEVLEVADGAQASPPTPDCAVPRTSVPEPIVSFQARRRVLQLIDKGNPLGAWAVAEPLYSDETEREWTKVIEWLARFASALPIPGDCDIPVLKHSRMAVRAALRVELALRAKDIPRAVHGTVSFFEAALWDHLLDHFERTGGKHRGLDVLRLKQNASPPQEPKLLRNKQSDEKDKRNCPFEQLDDGTYIFFEDGAGRFARDYVGKDALKKLTDVINRVRDLRNDVAHNEPTPELMDSARERMVTVGLWSNGNNPRFLTQAIVQDVLKELGVEGPSRLCDDLIETVRDRLLGHRLGRNKANE
ncbi:MAG: hypothetical protein KatS3mg076_2924 [Candidatus Binatia bacterium]|nr:MAG: hypothetical protein KatS3mg076_2924 [Candidatus Binatia bacterium]